MPVLTATLLDKPPSLSWSAECSRAPGPAAEAARRATSTSGRERCRAAAGSQSPCPSSTNLSNVPKFAAWPSSLHPLKGQPVLSPRTFSCFSFLDDVILRGLSRRPGHGRRKGHAPPRANLLPPFSRPLDGSTSESP